MKVCVTIQPVGEGGYKAFCPSLPGCICHADSFEEAKKKIDEAIIGYIASVSNFVPEHVVDDLIEV